MRNVEAMPEYPFQFVSILDLIWYTRGMYDVFLECLQGKEYKETNANVLANSISYNLNEAYNYLDQLIGTTEDVYNKYVIYNLLQDFEKNYSEHITENYKEIQEKNEY